MNSFGQIFRITTFGESHGPAMGGVVDGMPAGVTIDFEAVNRELARRRPGQSAITTARKETDEVEFLSGIFNGVTTGTPIGYIIRNADHHSADYSNISNVYRPGHADYTYAAKYGVRDYRGGGRQSARETVARVVAGALARQVLEQHEITITAYTTRIGELSADGPFTPEQLQHIDDTDVRCPDAEMAEKMRQYILDIKHEGDTVGGIVECVVDGVPAALGEPVFDKLSATLGSAMLSINAAKGVEFGSGFELARARGSMVADTFYTDEQGRVATRTNHSGGIQGGISNGMPITFRVAFKPVATLLKEIETIDTDGKPTTIHPHGRHDPCVVPRAVPIVEAMTACTLLDALLLSRASRL